ncbi:DUF397 domain-containing protein [Sphaerisporangium perillae]|uniref:DUF397 domain-containing protein n=1 Tax=Sphaerisporangium perillae TaxID=2935860 RepID=UPI0020105BF6|nr:DUF397 domain-containing protein [Sphaerisporangium perillae]
MNHVDVQSVQVPVWRKSSHSMANGECVEVAGGLPGARIGIRDSKDSSGPIITLPVEAWTHFVGGLKSAGL